MRKNVRSLFFIFASLFILLFFSPSVASAAPPVTDLYSGNPPFVVPPAFFNYVVSIECNNVGMTGAFTVSGSNYINLSDACANFGFVNPTNIRLFTINYVPAQSGVSVPFPSGMARFSYLFTGAGDSNPIVYGFPIQANPFVSSPRFTYDSFYLTNYSESIANTSSFGTVRNQVDLYLQYVRGTNINYNLFDLIIGGTTAPIAEWSSASGMPSGSASIFVQQVVMYGAGVSRSDIIEAINQSSSTGSQQVVDQLQTNDQNQQQRHEEEQQQREDQFNQMMDDDTAQQTTDAGSELTNWSTDFGGGISGVITAPLVAINSILTTSCQPLNLPLPFVNGQLILPCLRSTLQSIAPSIISFFDLLVTGFLSYWILIKIFAQIKAAKSPDNDEIEVFDL